MNNRDQRPEQPMKESSSQRHRATELGRPDNEYRRAGQEMVIIAEIGRIIGSSLDIDEVYERFASEARKLISFNRIGVILFNHEEDTATVAYMSGDIFLRKPNETFPLVGTTYEMIIRKRSGMIMQSDSVEEILARYPTLKKAIGQGVRSVLGVPLISRDVVIGSLYFWSIQFNAYTERDLNLAESIGEQIAGAIANAQLFADLKQTEKGLRESEARFRPLFEQTAVGVAEVDIASGRYFAANRRHCEILGMTEQEMMAASITAVLHPDDVSPYHEKLALLVAGTIGNFTLEMRYLRKDGKDVWVNVMVSPLWKPGEKPDRHIAVIEDITKRKRTEEEITVIAEIGRIIGSTLNLDEVFERFAAETRRLIPANRLAVSLFDIQRGTARSAYVWTDMQSPVQETIAPLKGRINEVLLRTRDGVLVQPDTAEELEENYPHLLFYYNREIKSFMSVPLISQDIVIGGLHFRSKMIKAYTQEDLHLAQRIGEQITGAIANAQLFNELQTTGQSLRESEARYRELLDLVPLSIFEIDANANFTSANRTAMETFKYSTKDAKETIHISRLIIPEQWQQVKEIVQRMLGNSITITGQEFQFVRNDGSTFPGLVYASRIVRENVVAGVRGAMIDITARKQMEEERRHLEERLRRAEKMEAIGQLAGGVAHDLNNVLGVLVGYSELLQEKIPKATQLRRYVDNILQSGTKGAAIIQDLLTLARRGVAVSDVLNLNQVVSDYLQSPEHENLMVHHPYVIIESNLSTGLLNVKGSPVHLSKTVMNLVSNAVESILKNGKVTIRTENRHLDKPVRGYDDMREGDYAILTVTDTGMGIPAADIGKIFEPFYTKKVMGRSGTGLGLAVVWGTVKDHNGYIDVQSEENKGSTFTLYFPVTREALIQDKEGVAPDRLMGHGEMILVVDDVKEQRELAVNMLTRLGYRTATVSSGEDAIEYFKANSVDLVVLDIIMDPGIDGLETYQKILEISPGQKAVIVSGFSETDRVKKAQELGAGAYVRKPYILEKIGMAIRDELNK